MEGAEEAIRPNSRKSGQNKRGTEKSMAGLIKDRATGGSELAWGKRAPTGPVAA